MPQPVLFARDGRTIERSSTLDCEVKCNFGIFLVHECVETLSLIRRKFVCERCGGDVGCEETKEAQERDGREHPRGAADSSASPV